MNLPTFIRIVTKHSDNTFLNIEKISSFEEVSIRVKLKENREVPLTHIKIFMEDGNAYVTPMTLKQFLKQLSQPTHTRPRNEIS